MLTFAIVVLVLVVFAYIGQPLFRGYESDDFETAGPVTPNLKMKKETLLNTLGEIEFDYHMNKLSTEDYQDLKDTYANAALTVLKAQDAKAEVLKSPKTERERLRAKIEQEIDEEIEKL